VAAVKAITLWQPWASLVALGVKSIETRSWSTSYRGPLAIHAAKKVVKGPVGDYYAETWYVVHDNFRCYCEADGVGPPCTRGSTRAPCLTMREKLVTMLPLGAVVATCTLVDVVPTDAVLRHAVGGVPGGRRSSDLPTALAEWPYGRAVANCWSQTRGRHDGPWDGPRLVDHREWPYGDFSPGRYAWLLADIERLAEPIPAKGRQGLWEWAA
jgi:hypothetical protein